MDKTNLDYGNQLIVITGGRGIGKTQLAATYLPPSRVGEVFYHDSEDSANNILAGWSRSICHLVITIALDSDLAIYQERTIYCPELMTESYPGLTIRPEMR